jgi:hypothetical protein
MKKKKEKELSEYEVIEKIRGILSKNGFIDIHDEFMMHQESGTCFTDKPRRIYNGTIKFRKVL